MTTKKKPAPVAKHKATEVAAAVSRNRVDSAMSPSVNAAAVMCSYGTPFSISDEDSQLLYEEQAGCSKTLLAGDTSRLEIMLLGQANALQAIFTSLSRRAAANMVGEYQPLRTAETYLRLALKAQSQCRSTIEALAEIKNPRPVAFVKQANISHGHQQVNNGMPPAHGNNLIQSNELSGASNELLPDARALQAESRIDTPVETVGEIDRAAN